MSLNSKELDATTNSTVYKKQRRKAIAAATGGCDYCPPHAKENEGRKPRRSWKFKNKTRHQHS